MKSNEHGQTGQSWVYPLWGLFLIALLVVITIAKSFFLPVFLAILLSMTFSPVVRSLRRRGVPEVLSATILVLIGSVSFALIISYVAEPFARWIEAFPAQFLEVKRKLAGVFEQIASIQNASDSITNVDNSDQATAAPDNENADGIVEGNGILAMAATNILAVATTTLVTMVLSFFLLAKGRVFYTKILRSVSTLNDKKEILSTVYTIERSISRYLLAVTVINVLLGVSIGLAMWALDMPSPLLWGIAAALLNYLPYIGALMGIIGSGVVAILTFDYLGTALVVPLVYMLLTGLEGQVVTPSIVGRSLSINPVVVFLALAMWSYMWGLAGALIAVPILVVVHTVAMNVEQLHWFGKFISDYDETENGDEEDGT